jgi:hypothetical protein
VRRQRPGRPADTAQWGEQRRSPDATLDSAENRRLS